MTSHSQPRKFSEKIALHNQKQAEGDAAFNQIMQEVTHVTSHTRHSRRSERSGRIYVGGSLPNVNHILSHQAISMSKNPFVKPTRDPEEQHISRLEAQTGSRERHNSAGSGGPVRSSRPLEKRSEPYPCTNSYLAPVDPSWRRASSDSALHHTLQSNGRSPGHSPHRSPTTQRRAAAFDGNQHYESRSRYLSTTVEKRPRSCCAIPNNSIPDINIYPIQHEPGVIPIPVSNNTGSLPDLTCFQFKSPIHRPLDQDDNNYSSASTLTLSPTSLPPRTPGRFSFTATTPPHDSSGPPSYASVSPPSSNSSKHLSVPYQNSFHQPQKGGFMMDGSPVESNNYQNSFNTQLSSAIQQSQQQKGYQQPVYEYQQPQQIHYVYRQQVSSPQLQSPGSPVDVSSAEGHVLNHHRNSLTSYRSPQSTNRPSPQSSPVLNHYSNNTSPLNSAPQSPTSSCASAGSGNAPQTFTTHGDFFVSQTSSEIALQQHFEQIRMVDSPVSSTVDFMLPLSNGPTASYHQQTDDLLPLSSNEITPDQGYYSTSPSQQLHYRPSMPSSRSTPTTSIPDIVLTDFSLTSEEDAQPPTPSSQLSVPKVDYDDCGTDEFSSFFPPMEESELRASVNAIDFNAIMLDQLGESNGGQQYTLDTI